MMNAIRFWKSDPRLYRDIIKQADAARDAKDLLGAARLYRQALTNGAPSGIRKQLANMLKDVGNYDEAFFQYHLCLENDPDDPDTLLQLGHLFKLQGNHAKARAYYARAATSPGTAVDARRELDWLQAQPSRAPADAPQTEADAAPAVGGGSSAVLEALEKRLDGLAAPSSPAAMQHANKALIEELRNSFDALVPLFLNTVSTIGRIGKTVEELTGRVQAIEHKVEAGHADTTRG